MPMARAGGASPTIALTASLLPGHPYRRDTTLVPQPANRYTGIVSIVPEISELDGGLRVVTTPLPTAQSVSVSVFVGAGSRGEGERTQGLAHFLEHMMFKGTVRRPTAI